MFPCNCVQKGRFTSRIILTLHMSRFNVTRNCILHNKGKTLIRLGTHDRQPSLALTGELWVSFVSYLEKIARDISGALCIVCTNILLHYQSNDCNATDIRIRSQKMTFTGTMMTSSNGSIFRVTGHSCGEFTCHRWSPLTKASDAELWCFLWAAPEQTIE